MTESKPNPDFAEPGSGMVTLPLPLARIVLDLFEDYVHDLRRQIDAIDGVGAPRGRGRPRKPPGAPVEHHKPAFGGEETRCPYCHQSAGVKGMHTHVMAGHPDRFSEWQKLSTAEKYGLKKAKPNGAAAGG
jgi:hypothetical protein